MKAWVAMVSGFLFSMVLMPAQEPSQMGISTLYRTAVQRVHVGDLPAAIPVLKELVLRFEGTVEVEKRAVLEEGYRYLAMAYMQSYNLSEDRVDLDAAVHYLSRYLEVFPEGRYVADVLLKRADCYRAQGVFEVAADDLSRVLNTATLVKSLDSKGRADVLKKLCEAYALERNWEAVVPWLNRWMEEAPNAEQKVAAAATLVEAHVALDQLDAALKQVPLLIGSDTVARYRVALNMALLEGGDKLTDMERYPEATLFYGATLLPDQMLTYFKERKVRLQTQLMSFQVLGASERQLHAEVFDAEQQIEQVLGLASYASDLAWRKARNFSQTGRSFEAFWAFSRLAAEYPEHEEVESFIYGAFIEALNSGLESNALTIAEDYLEQYQRYHREFSVRIAEIYAKRKDFDPLLALGRRFVENAPNDPFSSQFVYLMGNAWIERDEWDVLHHVFERYTRNYPDALIIHGCYYWRGLAAIFEGNFQGALQFFSELVDQYPESPYVEDATFRIGVCYFGLRDFDWAQERLEMFVQGYPESVLRGEAEGYLGDTAAARGAIERAIEHYEAVELYTQDMRFIDHAYFQHGKLLEANGRYRDMSLLFRTYLSKYDKHGNLPEAIYELGRANELLGNPIAMLEDYFQAIVQFGNDPRSYGVDRILEAYQTKHYEYRGKGALNPSLGTLEQRLTEAYYQAVEQSQRTLAYRLQRALDEIGSPIDLQKRFTPADFEYAGPRTLIWMGAKAMRSDRTFARSAYQAVLERYPDSEATREAYLKLGELEATDLHYAEAYQCFKQAQERFPSGALGAYAALRRADMLFEQERYKYALEEYKAILNTREWRGSTWAEASYKVGISFLKLGELGKAHGFFERTFLAFQDQSEWASRAYLKDGETLERMGERIAARNTYAAFLANPNFKQTDVYNEISARYHRLK